MAPLNDEKLDIDIGKSGRLIVEKMALNNFKSYKGYLEVGPFHKRFSSIVGPNGSGKSNVIDALLFVFGRRSSEIRFKKITDLIYKSADNVSAGQCSVSIHFCCIREAMPDQDGYDVVAGSRFEVAREVTEKGHSKYRIDGKACAFKDVMQLLSSKGIDLNNNRFLILQGEVESIAQMKPMAANENEKGLLEYLEEIIGSNCYVEKIEEALKRLEELHDLQQENIGRVRVVEREKSSLEGSRLEALEYLKKDREFLQKNILVQQIHLFYLRKGLDSLVANDRKLREQEISEKAKLEKLNGDFKTMAKEHEEDKRTFEHLERRCLQLVKRFNEFEEEDASINVNITFEERKLKKIKARLKSERQKVDAAEECANLSRLEIPKLEAHLIELESLRAEEAQTVGRVYKTVQSKTADIKFLLEEKQKELIPYKEEVNKFQQKVDELNGEIKLFEENEKRVEKRLEKQSAEAAELEAKIRKGEAESMKTEKSIEAQKESIAKAKASLDKIRSEKEKLRPALQEKKAVIDAAKKAFEKSRSSVGIIGELARLKREGVIPGIEGRLGSLGTIDAKYDVAVSTASNLLNSVLVDNAETGGECVRYLKENRLGIASFMMLDKQGHFAEACKRPVSTPGNTPRLYDQIRPREERFRPAFYCALRDTLFAENIDEAVRIANSGGKRWRVVTAGGEVIDSSGTMSGGGRSVRRGAMEEKTLSEREFGAEQIGDLSRRVAEMEERHEKLVEAERNLGQRISFLQKDLHGQSLALKKLAIDVANDTAFLRDIQTQLIPGVSEDDEKRKETRRSGLREKMQSSSEELDKAQAMAEKVSGECRALEKKILKKGGNEMIEAQMRLDEATKSISLANSKITEMNVNVSMGQKKCEASLERIKDFELQLEAGKAKLEALEKQSKSIEDRAAELLAENKREKDRREEVRQKMNAKQAAINENEEETKALRLSLVDIEDHLSDFANNFQTNKTKIVTREKRRDELVAKIRKAEAVINAGGEESLHFELVEEAAVPTSDKSRLEAEIEELQQQLKAMNPNMSVIEEYQSKLSEYHQRVESLSDVEKRVEEAKSDYDGFRQTRLKEFNVGFSVITRKLKEMYQLLTMGGDAELECVDRFDPFAEGIEFSVRPPKKSWKNISNLSGGEKTISSLSLVFALHYYKPTPLYVMDEIDAALDFKNVSIVANYIKQRTRDAQFIIISLRHSMFEAADRLVGIYKTMNFSKSLTIDPKAICVAAEAAAE